MVDDELFPAQMRPVRNAILVDGWPNSKLELFASSMIRYDILRSN